MVPCPHCGAPLFGSTTSRCYKCGNAVQIEERTDAERRERIKSAEIAERKAEEREALAPDSWRVIHKEVPWCNVYDCVCLLDASFKKTEALGDSLTIVCADCYQRFPVGWLEDAGMKSSLPGFIAFSSRKTTDFDRLKMKLADNKPKDWTCPECGSTNTIFTWSGINPFHRRRFNRALKLGKQC